MRTFHFTILPLLIAFYSNALTGQIISDDHSQQLRYCTSKQNKAQCDKMMQYNTRSHIARRFKENSKTYCDNEIYKQESCRLDMKDHLQSGCVSTPYVRELLFGGTPEQYDQTPENQRNYEYAPVCIGRVIRTFCKCGCFDKSTKILVEDKLAGDKSWTPIASLVENPQDYSLFSLESINDSDAGINLKRHEVSETLVGKMKDKVMVEIVTESGNMIKLTDDHPLLTEGREIVLAKEVRVGTRLVGRDGLADKAAKVTVTREIVDVFNVGTDMKSKNPSDHLIFANGLIVGDMVLQNSHIFDEANKKARD